MLLSPLLQTKRAGRKMDRAVGVAGLPLAAGRGRPGHIAKAFAALADRVGHAVDNVAFTQPPCAYWDKLGSIAGKRYSLHFSPT